MMIASEHRRSASGPGSFDHRAPLSSSVTSHAQPRRPREAGQVAGDASTFGTGGPPRTLACPRVALVDHLAHRLSAVQVRYETLAPNSGLPIELARGGDPLAPVCAVRGVTGLGLTYLGLLQIRNFVSALVLNLPGDFTATLNLDLAIGDRPRDPTGGAD